LCVTVAVFGHNPASHERQECWPTPTCALPIAVGRMFEFQPCRLAVADWHHLVTTSAASETGQKAHLSDKKTAASGLVKADPTFALSRRNWPNTEH